MSNFLRLIFGHPYLNPQDVEKCFTGNIMAIQTHDSRILEFIDYIL